MLKINENFIIFWKFLRKFGDFLKFFKILSKYSRKFREKFRKCGFLGGPPKLPKIFKKLVEKAMETGKIWRFPWIFSEFWLENANLNKN